MEIQKITNKNNIYRVFTKIFDRRFIAGVKKYRTFFHVPVRVIYQIFQTERFVVGKTKVIYLQKGTIQRKFRLERKNITLFSAYYVTKIHCN